MKRRPAESYYGLRRRDFTAGCAVVGGAFTGLYFGVTRWMLLVAGVQRMAPARGLARLQIAVLEGAAIGAICGAIAGWTLGFAWERWHRHRRG